MPDDPQVSAAVLRHIALLQARLDARREDGAELVRLRADLAQTTGRLREVQANLDEMTIAHDEGWASAARRNHELRQMRDQLTGQQAAAAAARAEEIARYESSLSWRVTAPLRAARRFLDRVRLSLRGQGRSVR
jgi:peptidoglycan hydrolase CwlO-like protein